MEEFVEMIPNENKCWVNKNNHKFIHSKTNKGLPLYIENTEEAIEEFKNEYKEVDIISDETLDEEAIEVSVAEA